MAILVLLSVISYRAMITALNNKRNINNYSEQLRELQLSLFILSRDIKQFQVSPLPHNNNAQTLPFQSNFGDGSKTHGILFSFFKSPNANTLQGVTHVNYQLKKGQLIQHVTSGQTTFSTPVLKNIKSASITFYDSRGHSLHRWQQNKPPAYIDITLQHSRYGKVVIKEAINA